MILRPQSDSELVALIGEVVADPALQLDTVAMIVCLLARKTLHICPFKGAMSEVICRHGKRLGAIRIARMIREAEVAGYMVRATWRVPRKGKGPAYSFIVGSKAAVRMAAQPIGGGDG